MKVSLTLDKFPMLLFELFKTDLSKYIDSNIQVGGTDTVFVNFSTTDVVKAQEAIIICDKYHFGGDKVDSILHRDETDI